MEWRFLVPLAIGLQMAISRLLLIFSQGVPLAIGLIVTTIGWSEISTVKQIAARQLSR